MSKPRRKRSKHTAVDVTHLFAQSIEAGIAAAKAQDAAAAKATDDEIDLDKLTAEGPDADLSPDEDDDLAATDRDDSEDNDDWLDDEQFAYGDEWDGLGNDDPQDLSPK
jgi:hypothetical protein